MGKKSRKNNPEPSGKSSSRNHPAILNSAVTAIANFLKLAHTQKLPIENYFSLHTHSVSSCDGDGAYNITSLFVLNPDILPPGSPEMSVITVICMRAHDNIRNTVFLPNDVFKNSDIRQLAFGGNDIGPNKTMVEYYHAFVDYKQNETGTGFRKAAYIHCSKLVNDCLLRMKAKKKVLVGKEERTVVRLFGLESNNPFHTREVTLPRPAQAPDINTLWLTMNRPEYLYFHVSGDLHDLFKCETRTRIITKEDLERSLDYLMDDEYRQARLLAMLDHMANWHMLGGSEEGVASWLLWERQSLMANSIGHPSTADAMKKNVIMQLMVNKFFHEQAGELNILVFPGLLEYGQGITNHLFYNQHMAITGRLPPAFIVTASVAEGVVGGSSICNNNAGGIEEQDTDTNIRSTVKCLRVRHASCAVCGTTRSTMGGDLSTCGTCESVAYCCREHQVFHWKQGGHKQQCSVLK